jgi:hypothetical protein
MASQERRYALLKAIYWRLPEQFRHKLNRQRHAYVARRLHHNFTMNQGGDHSSVFHAIEQSEWLVRANQAERIAIIPCGFEFDELVNQRPINAAKYFAAQGYLVLFVAWQWSPNDTLSKGCGEVWPNVYQVPLFDFVSKAEICSNFRKVEDLAPVKPCVSEVAEITNYPFITSLSPRDPLVLDANHIRRVAITNDADI